MSRRVFLDVGAHVGETMRAVLDTRFRFDQIVCFEPVPVCWEKLEAAAAEDPRVRVERFGLWNRNCERPVYAPGLKGASLWKKDNYRPQDLAMPKETCRFRRASEWFAENLAAGDVVYLKLNCEGAECDILDALLDSGEFAKATYAMVCFDVHKIDSERHRQAQVEARLAIYPFPRFATSKQVALGQTHADRIQNWLRLVAEATA